MACTEQRREQIAALAAGRSDADAAANLLQHVTACLECSEELDLIADLVAAEPETPATGLPRRTGMMLLAAAAVLAVLLWSPWTAASPWADLAEVAPIQAPPANLRGPEEEARGADYVEGLRAYRTADFAAAEEALRRVAAQRPGDALVHLYLGIARLQTGSPSAAVEPLRVAARSGTGLVRERGLWYLAGARLLLERPAEARAALEELRAEAGDYAANAETLLEALDARRR